MGQRLQCYIQVHNPLNNKELVENLKEKEIKHAYAIFGKKKTSVLAFHHQWLYGMTAAAICANIMREVVKSDNPHHILSKDLDSLPYPKTWDKDTDNVDGYFEVIQALLFVQFD